MRVERTWERDEEEKLFKEFVSGISVEVLAIEHKRNQKEIKSRLRRLGLLDVYGNKVTPPPDNYFYSNRKKRAKTIHLPKKLKKEISKESVDEKYATEALYSTGKMSKRLFSKLSELEIKDIQKTKLIDDAFFLSISQFGKSTLLELKKLRSENEPTTKKDKKDKKKNSIPIYQNESLSEIKLKDCEKNGLTAKKIMGLISLIIEEIFKNERDLTIIKLRLGIERIESSSSLASIGESFSISKERVRQIEKKAKKRLAAALKKNSFSQNVVVLKNICEKIFSFSDDVPDSHQLVFDFCINYMGQKHGGTISALIYIILNIESDFSTSEKRAKGLLRQYKIQKYETLKLKHKAKIKNIYAERRRLKNIQFWEKIFNKTIFPVHRQHFPICIPGMNERCREINENSIGNTGSFYSNKLSREVMYESNIEYKILSLIDNLDTINWYQEQPTKIPYRINKRSCTYFPDIALTTQEGLGIVIEVIPVDQMVMQKTLRKATAAINHLHDIGIGFLIIDRDGMTFKDFIEDPGNKYAEDELLWLIDSISTVKYHDYKPIMEKHRITFIQFLGMLIRNDLSYAKSPFRIHKLKKDLSFKIFL